LWKFPGVDPPDRLHVIVDDSRQASSCELMHVQRRSALLDRTYVRDGWPVVSVEAAVLGMAADLTFITLADAVQDLLRLRRTTTRRLAAVTGRGIKGSAMLRAALAVTGDGLGSKWERRLASELRRPDRPRAIPQLRIEAAGGLVAYVDLAFPDVGLAIEIDGYVAHSRPAEFRYDRRRQNALVAELGWTVLRYTPYEIASAPERIVQQIWRCYDRMVALAA
jgi:very-short-patch-repair endonuclease